MHRLKNVRNKRPLISHVIDDLKHMNVKRSIAKEPLKAPISRAISVATFLFI